MTVFADISSEILLLIFEKVIGAGKPLLPLQSLCLVCHRFRVFASSLLFKRAVIRIPRDHRTNDLKAITKRSREFITFLTNNEHVRRQVKTLYISRQAPREFYTDGFDNEPFPRDLLPLNQVLIDLITLLPLMSRLRHIRMSRVGSAQFPLNCKSAEPRFLEAVQQLGRTVSFSVFGHRGSTIGYIHTWNPNLFDGLSCSDSLQVNMLNEPQNPIYSESSIYNFTGTPSKDISCIISRNPRLLNVHLRLDGEARSAYYTGRHELEEAERQFALENIGVHIRPLESLTLEGKLHFTQTAWDIWECNMNWFALRSLSLIGEPLVKEVTERLVNCCPNLDSLRLDAQYRYRRGEQSHPDNSRRFLTDVTPFVSSAMLKQLSLKGFHHDNLNALKQGGSQLQRLLFHVPEGPAMWGSCHWKVVWPETFKASLLSPSHLESLQIECPRLEWLAFDIMPFHISREISISEPYTPVSGHSPSAYHNLPYTPCEPEDYENAKPILESQNPQRDSPTAPDPIFMSLKRFRYLRHLRLFIHKVHLLPWTFSLKDTMRTFLWLRKHKIGIPLESLVVYCGPDVPAMENGYRVGPGIVYEMGEGKLCTTEFGGTVLWQIKEDGGRQTFEIIEGRRVRELPDYRWMLDRFEDMDCDGWVIPFEWP